MVLETYSRDTNERYAVMGKNGIGFNVLPEPDIQDYGTRITLTLREDISLKNIVEAVIRVSRFSGVETHLTLEEDLEYETHDGESLPTETGRYKVAPVDFKEHLLDIVKREEASYRKLIKTVPVEIHDDDFDLYACFAVMRDSWEYVHRSYHSSGEVYLVGSPISAEISLPFSSWILNIKDERKYQPTADRERLSDQAITSMYEKVHEKVKEALAFLELQHVDDYINSQHKPIYDKYDELHLHEYLSARTIEICRFLQISVKTTSDKDTKTIAELFEESDNLFYLSSLNSDKIRAIRSRVPDAVVFRLSKSKYNEEDDVISRLTLLRNNGVIFGEEFLASNKIRAKREPKQLSEVVVHRAATNYYSWERFQCVRRHTSRCGKDAIDNKVIRIEGRKMRPYLNMLSQVQTSYEIVMDDKRIKKGIKLEELVKQLEDKMIDTSDGRLSLEQIARCGRKIALILYSDASISRHLGSSSALAIVGDADTLFEIMVFLEFNEVKYTIDTDGHKSLDKYISGKDLHDYEFVYDSSYSKIGDSEILYSVVHAVKEVRDERLLNLFLNAARYCRSAKEVVEMRMYVLRLNEQLKETNTIECSTRGKR